LIAEACREQEITLDEAGFQRALEDQRERARKSAAFEVAAAKPGVTELGKTVKAAQFVGYDHMESDAVVQAILKGDKVVREAAQGDEIELVLDVTPFYAEGGGQAGDQGLLTSSEGRIDVKDTTRPAPAVVVHKGVVLVGRIAVGQTVHAAVNATTRMDAARNHTATHLVHAALRELLGPHVKQYGSLVTPSRLRFDFAHFRPLTARDIDDIETMVNEQIRRNQTVRTDVMGIQDAVQAGALAFFGDKYGNDVRVVTVDTFSKELCGGTHCAHTGEIGLFRLVSETGVAAGVRRIECVTGSGALMQVRQLEREMRELSELLKASPSDLAAKTKKLLQQLKDTERELEQVKLKMASGAKDEADVREVKGVTVHVQRVDGMDGGELRALSDQIRDKLKSGVIALGGVKDDKVALLVVVTKDLTAMLKAGELIKDMAAAVGGTGGGRPEMAQAGGKHPEGLPVALGKVFELVARTAGA